MHKKKDDKSKVGVKEETKATNEPENNKITNCADAKAEEFMGYRCFYCDENIASEDHTVEHRKKCRETTRRFCTAPLGLPAGLPVRKPLLLNHSPFNLLGPQI